MRNDRNQLHLFSPFLHWRGTKNGNVMVLDSHSTVSVRSSVLICYSPQCLEVHFHINFILQQPTGFYSRLARIMCPNCLLRCNLDCPCAKPVVLGLRYLLIWKISTVFGQWIAISLLDCGSNYIAIDRAVRHALSTLNDRSRLWQHATSHGMMGNLAVIVI